MLCVDQRSTMSIANQFDVMAVCKAAGLGPVNNILTNKISVIPGPTRTLLVSLVLDRIGKKSMLMKFSEMLMAVNTYTPQIGFPTFDREGVRKASECLVEYGILRGGPSQYVKRMNLDDVSDTPLYTTVM